MVTQVIDQVPRVQFTASGGQTVFPYTFLILVKTDITVEQEGGTLVVDVDYTVSDVGNINGGNITLTSGATVNDSVTVFRSQNFDREVDYQESGDFLAGTVNGDFNRAILMLQQLREELTRTLQYGIDDTITERDIPVLVARIGKVLGFDGSGNLNVQEFTDTGSASDATIAAAVDNHLNQTRYELGSIAGLGSHTGIAIGHIIKTDYLASNRTPGSGSEAAFTGTTTPGLASTWFGASTDKFGYDALGQQFEIINDQLNARMFGVLGNGSTDDTAKINQIIAALSNGRTERIVLDFSPGIYPAAQIIMKPHVGLRCTGGSFLFNGSAGEAIFESLITEVVFYADLIDIMADCGVGGLVSFHSYHSSFMSFPAITSNSLTSTLISIIADSTGGAGPTGTRNVAGNFINGLDHNGTCGTGLYIEGLGALKLTLNEFKNFVFQNTAVIGYELAQNVDNNTFSGIHRCNLSENNGIGIDFGSTAGDKSVFFNIFHTLAIDAFGAKTGRIQVQHTIGRANAIDHLYADDGGQTGANKPTTFNIVHADSASFLFNHTGITEKVRVFDKGGEVVGNFKMANNTAQVTSGTTPLDIVYQTPGYDYGENFVSMISPSFGRAIIPVKGIYAFTFNATGVPSVGGDTFFLDVEIRNASDVFISRTRTVTPMITSAVAQTLQISADILLDVTNRAYVVLTRRSGTGTFTLTGGDPEHCTWSCRRISG